MSIVYMFIVYVRLMSVTAVSSERLIDLVRGSLVRQRLDEASQAAAAAVQTGTSSLETIRKQVLAQHKQIELMRKKHK